MYSKPVQETRPLKPDIGAELQHLISLMRKVAWLNLYFGLISVCYYLTGLDSSSSTLIAGLVSVAMNWLVKMKISYINGTKSWIEVSVTTACGLYLPLFTLLMTCMTMAGLLG